MKLTTFPKACSSPRIRGWAARPYLMHQEPASGISRIETAVGRLLAGPRQGKKRVENPAGINPAARQGARDVYRSQLIADEPSPI